MKTFQWIALAVAVTAVSACNRQAATENSSSNQASSEELGRVYSGSGRVTSISADQVTIAHGPIQAIGWPAMTMAYTASPDIAIRVKVGAQVDFSFRKSGSAYVLTSLRSR